MKYSKRDLRAFDIFALLMFGIGALFLAMGGIRYFSQPTIRVAVTTKDKGKASMDVSSSKASDSGDTVETRNWPAVRTGLLGIVFIALGTAMNIGLRRVVRNNGKEPSEGSSTGTAA